MHAGSACLHCAFAGMQRPLEQKLPAGQLTLAQALACAIGSFALQVPSDWHTPSPQSAFEVQPVFPGATLQDSSKSGSQPGCCTSFLSTHAAARSTTANNESFPNPIPHPQKACAEV